MRDLMMQHLKRVTDLSEERGARIAALEAQNKRLVEALEKIRDFDAKQRAGYVDEWEEAWAFSQCQTIANDLLTEVTK